jgi:hypothetical protein
MDVIYDLDLGISDTPEAVMFAKDAHSKKLDDFDAYVDLLQPVFKHGKLVKELDSIHTLRKNAIAQVNDFYKIYSEKEYLVGLEKNLFDLKQKLVKERG